MHLRFLQLQLRSLEKVDTAEGFAPTPELEIDGRRLFGWEEAVEHEIALAPFAVDAATGPTNHRVVIPGGQDVEPVTDAAGTALGRVVRTRWPLAADGACRVDPARGVRAALHRGRELGRARPATRTKPFGPR